MAYIPMTRADATSFTNAKQAGIEVRTAYSFPFENSPYYDYRQTDKFHNSCLTHPNQIIDVVASVSHWSVTVSYNSLLTYIYDYMIPHIFAAELFKFFHRCIRKGTSSKGKAIIGHHVGFHAYLIQIPRVAIVPGSTVFQSGVAEMRG